MLTTTRATLSVTSIYPNHDKTNFLIDYENKQTRVNIEYLNGFSGVHSGGAVWSNLFDKKHIRIQIL